MYSLQVHVLVALRRGDGKRSDSGRAGRRRSSTGRRVTVRGRAGRRKRETGTNARLFRRAGRPGHANRVRHVRQTGVRTPRRVARKALCALPHP